MRTAAYKALILSMVFLMVAIMASCDKDPRKQARNKAANAITVDALMADPDRYLDQEVAVKGFCTYFNHRTSKVYLRGRELILLRLDASQRLKQQLDTACINHRIVVEGIFKENKIDSASIAQFEKQYDEALSVVRRGDSLIQVQQQAIAALAAYNAYMGIKTKPEVPSTATEAAKNKEIKEEFLADPENFAARMDLFRQKIAERDSIEGKPYISEYYIVTQEILKVDK